ncbi:uncharacterized protein LOC119661797, partial [Teleopsis dalmanni]|uniref:uncharacterized protein LOC119661797 n=1 Tax=Teleopsis dalmanni TaxID=139649 RepID=UPI0018CDA833
LFLLFTAEKNKILECWHCSSDTIGSKDFCDTTFQEDNIPTEILKDRRISVSRHCNNTINSMHERAVCRKTVEKINGETITKRFCYYTNKSDPLDHCQKDPTESSVQRIFCEDCETNKCNSAKKMGVMLGGVVLPVLVAKLLEL